MGNDTWKKRHLIFYRSTRTLLASIHIALSEHIIYLGLQLEPESESMESSLYTGTFEKRVFLFLKGLVLKKGSSTVGSHYYLVNVNLPYGLWQMAGPDEAKTPVSESPMVQSSNIHLAESKREVRRLRLEGTNPSLNGSQTNMHVIAVRSTNLNPNQYNNPASTLVPLQRALLICK